MLYAVDFLCYEHSPTVRETKIMQPSDWVILSLSGLGYIGKERFYSPAIEPHYCEDSTSQQYPQFHHEEYEPHLH